MNAPYALSSRDIVLRDVDVLVLGGGMSGVFAALAAKTPHLSVAIVEPSNILGGQGTAGGVAGFVGDTARVNYIFADLVARLTRAGKIEPYRSNDDRRAYDLESCGFALQCMLDEAGIETWLHAAALDAKAENGSVTEVLVRCGPTLVRVSPRVVIDATGNAVIASALGCPVTHLGAREQLPMSLYFTLWNTHQLVRPLLPEGCPSWERDDELPMTSLHGFADGRVEVKMKVVGFDAADGFSLSKAEIHARRQMMGLVYYLQTRGYGGRHTINGGAPLATYTLAHTARSIGQREGRRIIGKATLTDADVRSGAVFDDAVAVGTYHLDFHWPATERRAGTGVTDMVEPYHIPLGAMIPQGASNVLCPGRSLSGEQLALSSYRAMTTCAQMGFGAGKAAALAAAHGGDIERIDIKTLRRDIEAGGQSLDLSTYGDYLRCLRRIDEDTGLVAEGEAELKLVRARNGRTYLACLQRSGKLTISLRFHRHWSTVAVTQLAGPARLVRFASTGDGLLDMQLSDGGGRLMAFRGEVALASDRAPLSLQLLPEPGLTTASTLERSESLDGGSIAMDDQLTVIAISPTGASAVRSDCRTFQTTLVARILDGHEIQLYRADGAARANGAHLIAFVKAPAKETRFLILSHDLNGAVTPDMIATPIGIAVAFSDLDGRIRLWEGALEQFSALGSPAPDPRELQRAPYQDRVLLAGALGDARQDAR